MNCPRCNGFLETHIINGVAMEECVNCRGIWFSKDELRKAKDQADPDLAWIDFDLWKDPEKLSAKSGLSPCPVCQKPMAQIEYDETDVTVDVCPGGDGTWLDNEEFEQIIAVLEKELESKTSSDYIRTTLQEAGELVRGHEKFASEWKDFTTVFRLMEYRILIEHPRLAASLDAIRRGIPFQ